MNNNTEIIRLEIEKKQDNSSIYYPNSTIADKMVIDIDKWPYPRFYRGPNKVMEREAGVRSDCLFVPFDYYFHAKPDCVPTSYNPPYEKNTCLKFSPKKHKDKDCMCKKYKHCMCEKHKHCMCEKDKECMCEKDKECMYKKHKHCMCEKDKECMYKKHKDCGCEKDKECMYKKHKDCGCEKDKDCGC